MKEHARLEKQIQAAELMEVTVLPAAQCMIHTAHALLSP